jgi:hypothetical protein
MACGAAGMSESDFWGGEVRDALLRISGYREMERAAYRAGWEQARLISDVVVACMTKSKSAGIKFAWDNRSAPPPKQQTPEQAQALLKRREKLDKMAIQWRAAQGTIT